MKKNLLLILGSFFLIACKGKDGINGTIGPIGIPGESLVTYSAPASLSECPAGGTDVFIGQQDSQVENPALGTYTEFSICDGAQGATGQTGAIGQTGQTGATGAPGNPGTMVTPIQFCPNVTPTYPSNFPEFGFCIAGNIYAVYSTNDGFLSILPPGEYSSDGVGASCVFNVETNCSISY